MRAALAQFCRLLLEWLEPPDARDLMTQIEERWL